MYIGRGLHQLASECATRRFASAVEVGVHVCVCVLLEADKALERSYTLAAGYRAACVCKVINSLLGNMFVGSSDEYGMLGSQLRRHGAGSQSWDAFRE